MFTSALDIGIGIWAYQIRCLQVSLIYILVSELTESDARKYLWYTYWYLSLLNQIFTSVLNIHIGIWAYWIRCSQVYKIYVSVSELTESDDCKGPRYMYILIFEFTESDSHKCPRYICIDTWAYWIRCMTVFSVPQMWNYDEEWSKWYYLLTSINVEMFNQIILGCPDSSARSPVKPTLTPGVQWQ